MTPSADTLQPSPLAESAFDEFSSWGTLVVAVAAIAVLVVAVVVILYDLALGVCASSSHSEITSGHSSGTVVAPYSCQDLLDTSTGTQDFTWNTGATSTLSFTRTVTIVNGQNVITLTGHITSGLFTGDTGVLTIIEPVLDLTACQSPTGLTSTAGVTTLLLT
ncbi:hypothetical protein [Kitasatospora sp. NPDC004272]